MAQYKTCPKCGAHLDFGELCDCARERSSERNTYSEEMDAPPELKYKEQIIKLFNTGKLMLDSAEYYRKRGYAIICGNGRVTDIQPERI